MKSLAVSLLVCCVFVGAALGQNPAEQAVVNADKSPLLSMPEPPLGYSVAKAPILLGERLVGFRVLMAKENSVTKVVISVELADRSTRPARVAAFKGYVNGLAQTLVQSGMKLTAQKLPDIDKVDFDKPVALELTFTKPDGTTLLVRKRVFFTTKGYDISILAEDPADLERLTEWTLHVKPATPSRP